MTTKKTIIEKLGTEIIVISEYNSEFIKRAKRLGGCWENGCWVFDLREEKKVRTITLECLGTDGYITDLVDARVMFTEKHNVRTGPIEFCGRTIARAFGRDSGAKLGNGVVLESGNFTSGGSVKNWETCAEDAVCIIRDLAKTLVEKAIEEETHEIVAFNPKNGVDVYENLNQQYTYEELKNEKIKLLERIKDIDKLLDSYDTTKLQ